MVLHRRYSDLRHRCKQGVVSDRLTHAPLELIDVLATGLVHDLTHPVLALLKRTERLVLGRVLLPATANAAAAEVDLPHRELAHRILH